MGLVMQIRFVDVLQPGSLKNYYVNGKISGYQFSVRLGYYRGHYLSVIDRLGVSVDGKEVRQEDILFCVNDKAFMVHELKYQVSEFWNIRTPAIIRVRQPGGLAVGDHMVDLTLMLRSPYLPLPGASEAHTYTPIDSCERKSMKLSV